MAFWLESLRANWKVTLLAVIMLPILLRLGFWQLDRADEKRAIEAMFLQRASQPALTSLELNQHCQPVQESGQDHNQELGAQSLSRLLICESGALAFRLLNLHGSYLNDYSGLLDNQIQQGRPGYHVITPFVSGEGVLFWINRGWVEASPDRKLPAIPEVLDELQLSAGVYLPQGEAIVLADDVWPDGWPVLMQAVDLERLLTHLPEADIGERVTHVFPYLLRLEPGYAGEFNIDWPLLNMKAQMHTGYAVQWFAMAFAVTLFWGYLLLKNRS